DTEVNLYYFGARWYDAELGMWLSPDPAGQYFNPYSYADGNVVMLVDADGNFFFVAAILVGAAIGAYYGGAKATGSWTWEGFDITKDWDEVLTGAAVGAAIGGGAAYAGVIAGNAAVGSLSLGTSLTATSTSGILA